MEHGEPYDGRLSRTVRRAAGGEVRRPTHLDLDADVNARMALRREIARHLGDRYFRRSLVPLGIRDIVTDQTAAKDTDTTLRFKLRLVTQGGVPLPTKIEISFRDPHTRETAVEESVSDALARRYLSATELPLLVSHYPRLAALRQKIAALALRTAVQSRDVFDMTILMGETRTDIDLLWLRECLNDEILTEAHARTLAIPETAFRGEVLEFIDAPAREYYAERWEELQLVTANLIEAIRASKPEAHE